MKTNQPLSRREFFKTTGGTFGLLTMALQAPTTMTGAAEGNPQPVKRDSAALQRLLEEMEGKGYQFWSVPRKDGEFPQLMGFA